MTETTTLSHAICAVAPAPLPTISAVLTITLSPRAMHLLEHLAKSARCHIGWIAEQYLEDRLELEREILEMIVNPAAPLPTFAEEGAFAGIATPTAPPAPTEPFLTVEDYEQMARNSGLFEEKE